MTKELDILLSKVNQAKKDKEIYEILENSYRKQLLELLKKEEVKTYKNDFATVSSVERKTIKFNIDKSNVVADLMNKNLQNFIDYTPEQVVPAKYELNKDFEDRVKKGVLEIEGVEVVTSETVMVKFN